jgi:signal transduction histidine kinase
MGKAQALGAAPVLPVDRAGLVYRLRIIGVEVQHVGFAVPALALLILTLVGWPLTLVGAGLILVHMAVPLTERLAGLHRGIAGRMLGQEITAEYATTGHSGVISGPWSWIRDAARWRDVGFLAFASSAGFALSMAVVCAPAALVTHLVIGIVFGGWWWLLLPVDAVLWWVLTPYLARARALSERAIFGWSRTRQLQRRVEAVAASRAETIDHSAAELRRIERDLHDGAQARIVSVGMHLGLAEELMLSRPEAAAALLAEARQATTSALEDLRAVVRGIHPPVLADRGLVGAIEALAIQLAVPVTITAELPGRVPAPVETAVYFAVAECLANVVKHSGAGRAWVTLRRREGLLSVEIGDDGRGGADLGADPARSSGLAGLVRRLAAFDGTMQIDSPGGGPTIVTLEVPCESSSPRTSPS